MYNKNRIICVNSKTCATLTQSNQSHREKNCDLIAFLCPNISGLEYTDYAVKRTNDKTFHTVMKN